MTTNQSFEKSFLHLFLNALQLYLYYYIVLVFHTIIHNLLGKNARKERIDIKLTFVYLNKYQ
jgi:hypothetical protein